MGVEGPSMITTFSLIVVALAMSISVFVGSYFLKPTLDLQTVLGSVAYDISTLYDVAYTLPGTIKLKYFGNDACTWNYNVSSDDISAFVCYSGDSNLIKDIYVAKEYLLVANDPYMKYDFAENAQALFLRRPAFFSVNIPFWDAALTDYNVYEGVFLYTSLAYAPFAASYSDIDMIANYEADSVTVKDYSFVVGKNKVGTYYNTLKNSADISNPQDLESFMNTIFGVLNTKIKENTNLENKVFYFDKDYKDDEYYLKLLAGYRFHIYEDDLICQERISLSKYYQDLLTPDYENSFDEEGDSKGKIGNSLNLNESNDLNLNEDNKIYNNFTISFYLKSTNEININTMKENTIINDFENQNYLFSSETHSNNYIGISAGTNGIVLFTEKTNGDKVSNIVYESNLKEWNHIIISYVNKIPTLYINGKLIKKGKQEEEDIYLSNFLTSKDTDYIDELKVYDSSLTFNQVNAIYTQEVSKYLNNEYGQGLNEYYVDYCFNLSEFVDRRVNDYVDEIIIDQDFKDIINEKTAYCVSQISCILPKLNYITNEEGINQLIVNGTIAYFNPITGNCQKTKPSGSSSLSCGGGI